MPRRAKGPARKVPVYATYLNEDRACVLVKEAEKPFTGCLNSPEEIVDFLRSAFHMHILAEEQMMLICFDVRLAPVGVFLLSRGSTTMSVCPVREIFKKALLCNSTNIAIAHNHPSGEVSPSQEDIKSTDRIREAGKVMEVELIDHIIIGGWSYFSLREHDWRHEG